jgi:hypothetical protein
LWNSADFADLKLLAATVGPQREMRDLHLWIWILDPADLPIDSWLAHSGAAWIEFFIWNSANFADLKLLMATVGPQWEIADLHPWTWFDFLLCSTATSQLGGLMLPQCMFLAPDAVCTTTN